MSAPHRNRRDPLDRAFDVGLGLSSFATAGLGLAQGDALPLPVGASVSAVNATVGLLFLLRSGAATPARPRDVLGALPSIVLSGVAYRLAGRDWPAAAIAAHAAFALLAVIGLATLGRSFAVLPARRGLVVRGPYRLVRHPIYLAELGMVVCACATRGLPAALGALVLATLAIAPRIRAEERTLLEDAAYAAYRAEVRHRLLPGLF